VIPPYLVVERIEDAAFPSNLLISIVDIRPITKQTITFLISKLLSYINKYQFQVKHNKLYYDLHHLNPYG
jgi:hypothetical protein